MKKLITALLAFLLFSAGFSSTTAIVAAESDKSAVTPDSATAIDPPMLIPKTNIDPKMLIPGNPDIDPKMLIAPQQSVTSQSEDSAQTR